MAQPEKDFAGFWGEPTATIDWCEANYEVTYYIAEFWNTVSNIVMIIPPLIGALMAKSDGLESRFIWCHISLAVVGIGSWCFHGTLLYSMQLLDELPMIWGSAFLLYSLIEIDGKPQSQNKTLQLMLITYCAIVTAVYVTIKNPIFHEVAYGLMVGGMIISSIRIVRKYDHSFVLFVFGLISYLVGFIIWNVDNIFCRSHRELRSAAGYPMKAVLQGHAWWHILAGTGTFLALLFATHARAKYLKKNVKLEMAMKVWPYIRTPTKERV